MQAAQIDISAVLAQHLDIGARHAMSAPHVNGTLIVLDQDHSVIDLMSTPLLRHLSPEPA